MAAPSTRQYNLRSSGQETVLPVELHYGGGQDSTFMKDLLVSQKASASWQVCDNDSSINDSHCEALIDSSDDKQNCDIQVVGIKSGKKMDHTVSDTLDLSQQAINMQILSCKYWVKD